MNTNRQPAGIPTGGQFAASAQPRPTIALDGGGTTRSYATFDDLPEPAQQALRHWSHEQPPEDQEAWQREQGYRYEIETVPMAELQRRIMANLYIAETYPDFAAYQADAMARWDIPDHGSSRWPVIEAEPSLDPDIEYLDDGYHRFASYVAAGDESVDVLRILA